MSSPAPSPHPRRAHSLSICLSMLVMLWASIVTEAHSADQEKGEKEVKMVLPGIIAPGSQQNEAAAVGQTSRLYATVARPIKKHKHKATGTDEKTTHVAEGGLPARADTTRYGEKSADLSDIPPQADPRIQLLREGRAQRFPEDESDTPALILAEQSAITASKGLWSQSCCRIIDHTEAHNHTQEWRVVRGRVLAVKVYSKKTYVNFAEDWRRDFSLTLSANLTEELNPKSWEGKEIEVRGWIHWSNGPMIDIFSPAQVYVKE